MKKWDIIKLLAKLRKEIDTLRMMRQFHQADQRKHQYKLLKAKLRQTQ